MNSPSSGFEESFPRSGCWMNLVSPERIRFLIISIRNTSTAAKAIKIYFKKPRFVDPLPRSKSPRRNSTSAAYITSEKINAKEIINAVFWAFLKFVSSNIFSSLFL
jgi:hypothetical protein